jgi:hypothetical protein
MKNIKKDELFRNLGGFLKSKGIELNDGSYTARIQQGCNLLSDAINATQKTVSQTKVKVDHALDQLRQTIHETTAPPPPPRTKAKKPSAPRGKRSAAAAYKKDNLRK